MSTDLLSLGRDSYNKELETYINKERAAVELVSAVGRLLYDKSVELVLFRNHLVNTSVSEILQLHKYAAEVVQKPIDVFVSSDLANILAELDLAPAKIDIGRLSAEWMTEGNQFANKREFLVAKIGSFLHGNDTAHFEPRDVVLFGFGRIGRLATRELIQQFGKGRQLRLKAIVTRKVTDDEIIKRGDLLRVDSVHGPFPGTVVADLERKALIINGQIVKMIDRDTRLRECAQNSAEIRSPGLATAIGFRCKTSTLKWDIRSRRWMSGYCHNTEIRLRPNGLPYSAN